MGDLAVEVDLDSVVGGWSAEWPAWAVPAIAVGEWLDLQAAVLACGRRLACETDPEAWWAARGTEAQAGAVEACSWCPVRVECRTYAVAARERDGVWGGSTADERRLMGGPR